MALYPNTSTKQIINTEIKKKINTLDSRIENVNDIAEQAQSTANNALNSVSDLSTVVDDKQTQIDAINETLDTVQSTLSEKQDTLTFDNEPLLNSDNPVKSSGIYTELEKKLDKDNVKFDPEPNGTDALSTGGAYDIVQDLAEQIHNVQNGVVLQSTDETQFVNNGGIIIDNTQEEVTNAIEVRNGDTKLKDTDVDGDLTSTTLAVENDATIGGNATVDGNVTSNEFIGGLEKSISITDENNTTHTFNNTDNVSLSGVLKAQKDINGDSIDSTYVKNATKGVANGIATLDENGRLPYSQLPESAMELKGLWDASTNTPTLVQGVGTNGDFYIVSVGGTQFGETFNVNDRIVFVSDDNTWHRLPYTITSPVSSVNNKIGAVTLYGTDIQKSNSDSETITHALDDILNKIDSLDASSVGGSGKYISEISETNGKISATTADITDTVTRGNMNPVTSNAVYGAISKFGNVINAVFRTPTNAIPIDASNLDLCSLTLPIGRWLLSISTRVDINGATQSCLFGGFSLSKGGIDHFIAVSTTDGVHFEINDTRVVDITTDNTVYYWTFYNLGLNNVSTINLTGLQNCVAIRLQ